MIQAESLDGKCHVRHVDDISDLVDWVMLEDHYFVVDSTNCPLSGAEGLDNISDIRNADEVVQCSECQESRNSFVQVQKRLREKPLRGLDMFSGLSIV